MRQFYFFVCVCVVTVFQPNPVAWIALSRARQYDEIHRGGKKKKHLAATDFWKNRAQWVTRLLEVRPGRNVKGLLFFSSLTGHQKKERKMSSHLTSQRQSGVRFLVQSLSGPVVKSPPRTPPTPSFSPTKKQRQ